MHETNHDKTTKTNIQRMNIKISIFLQIRYDADVCMPGTQIIQDNLKYNTAQCLSIKVLITNNAQS